ncbi:hypothetical protein MAR_004807 [Mya arenaria]|uniref:Uncharacterized protein n=1 Tax=Mya arenaria TaxID=6604 RepID=A0ABY7EZC5_MYAAR|nr:hypothetical protein MAR_004807 [Mya arenaria]
MYKTAFPTGVHNCHTNQTLTRCSLDGITNGPTQLPHKESQEFETGWLLKGHPPSCCLNKLAVELAKCSEVCAYDKAGVIKMDICKLLLTMVIALSTWTQAVFVKQSIPVPEDNGRNTPPDPPVNSPTLRCSPDKCVTPTNSEMDPSKGSSQHIWEQLDEVRSRLYYGAGRKIEKVRSHVRSFTDTGSLKIREMKDAGSMKIQSIKESGSHAASVAKKTVTSGMFQVKYSVQSIKEFCGTGEMGPGTVSMVSVSTDVDTHEEVKIVRSHTFV